MTEWQVKKVGDITDTQLGKMLNKGKQSGKYAKPYLRTDNVHWGRFDLSEIKAMDILPEEQDKYLATKGDLLMCEGGASGRTAIWNEDYDISFQNHVHRIRPKDPKEISPKYLLYYFEWFIKNGFASDLIKGVTISSLSQSGLRSIEVTYPTIDEQHKIVELLEDHLSRLDAALADVKQAKTKAAQFRRSFIHEMTTAIESSEVMGILDICDVYQPKTIATKDLISDGEFPVYGANGQIGFYNKFNHEESEVTVTCRGATCGTVNVIPAMSWITGNAMVFRPKDSRIQKGFLEYVLRGMDWTPVITGTAQPQITRTSIQDVFVNVPSPDIQNDIYMKLESSLTQVTNAALLSEKVEMQAASLRRSLLQAAFTGQLTKEVVSV
jgi:restriction endonuclease S subunit